ncbi:MAG: bacteriohemerythrin [Lachnospiraceae bacterium]|nr:bacteriohemerythrin [Lachnospiraceae bacterium]
MYQFTEDCLIGVPDIDGEHRQLFQMLNETVALLEQDADSVDTMESAKELIWSLEDYAATHFMHEEAYMEQIGDGELLRQKKEHQEFIENVKSYEIASIDADNGRMVIEELLEYLSRWLYRHILGSDMMIGYHTASSEQQASFAFTEEYKTGIAFVDEEHRRLFEIIRETNDLIQDTVLHDKYDRIVHILGELKEYTILHFRDEEEYMESIQYTGLEAQRYAHQSFVDRLDEIDMNGVDENQQEYLVELIDYLLDWLVNHILKMDKRIPVKV